MLVFAAYPSAEDIEDFKNVSYYINSNGYKPFFVSSLIPRRKEVIVKSRVLIVACINLVFNLICGMLAMVLCTICMLAAVKKATSSSKSMRLQNQLQKLLFVQFLIPFICIQVPFFTCCLGPLVQLEITGTDTGSVADYLPFLFAWPPALNPAAVLYFVRDLWTPVRHFLFSSRVEPVAVSKVSITQKPPAVTK
ncbi:unnamed protein product [Cylicocyclus nassatus]|uniref:Uncharacterized protein n=1 Tax=Cylicocyclus nassatus TaxID=53992 RepID=A0AA36MB22_CYLNA|nr:unnamed protein product [Cylicocyclus nassatus]